MAMVMDVFDVVLRGVMRGVEAALFEGGLHALCLCFERARS